jgi:hypothetical protein
MKKSWNWQRETVMPVQRGTGVWRACAGIVAAHPGMSRKGPTAGVRGGSQQPPANTATAAIARQRAVMDSERDHRDAAIGWGAALARARACDAMSAARAVMQR